jgi:hypothetical protein
VAVAFRSAGTSGSQGSGATLTLGLPAGAQSGDYLIAFLSSQSTVSTADWSPPGGWTKIGPSFTASSSSQRVTSMFAKFAGGSEPSTYDFTNDNSTVRQVGIIHAYTGVHATVPVAASSGFTATSTAATTLNVSAFPAASNLYTIQLTAAQYASPNSYAISSYTGGLSLQSSVFRASGATQDPPSEDTSVSRAAMRVHQGSVATGGMPAHVITTTGSFAQMCTAIISLNPASVTTPVVVPNVAGHTTSTSSGSSGTFTVDPGVNLVGAAAATDDWIILTLSSAGNSASTKQPTPPGGWSTLIPFGTVGTGTTSYGVWAHKRADGESTYTWTQTTAESQNTYQRMLFVRNAADISLWLTGVPGTRAGSGGTVTTTAPSITTTSVNNLALLIAEERTTTAETDNQVTCDNFTKQWFDNSFIDHSIFVATKGMTAAGATGTVTVTYPNTHTENGHATIFGIPGNTYVGLPIKVSDGAALVDARFRLADGAGGFINPGAYRVVRPGYANVTQLLAQTTFYVSHRGGSRDFPECSLYAYGQAALRGYPAFDLPLARTSDGVFFGLHDDTMDRTSGTTNVFPGTLTWAQVQASYEILGSSVPNNPTQADQPYMRFEELMDMYYDTHVIFVDPKYLSSAHRLELLDLMDTYPNPTTHFVGKYYGVSGNAGNTTGPAQEWSNRGYTTWGYFYDSDAANYAAYQGRWSMLGMNIDAAGSEWTAILSYGKPVMGHIAQTSADVATAISKGADGVMVSGAISVTVPDIT